jgi:chromosome segregation ATPase
MNQNLQTVLTAAGTAIAGVVLATALGIGPKTTTTSIVKVPAKSVTLAPKANGILKSDGTTVEEAFAEANQDISAIRREAAEARQKIDQLEQVVGEMLRDGSKAVRTGVIESIERETKDQLTRARSESKLVAKRLEDEAKAKREELKEAERKAKDAAKAAKSDAKSNPLGTLLSGLGVSTH